MADAAFELDYGGGTAETLVLASDAAAAATAVEAVALAGGRLVGRASLTDVDACSKPAILRTALVELAGADEAEASDALVRVDSIVRDREIHAVVCFGEAQIDLVTARIFGPHVTLLCDPMLSDRVAALAVAGRAPDTRHHDIHDEAERLRLLNAEVARIADTLARLTQREETGPVRPAVKDPGLRFAAEPETPLPAVTAADVRNVIRARRLRGNHFGAALFADPAWDMLLDLFAADLERRRVSVSSLCIAAAVPGTTALRWIGTMVEEELFDRQADPLDRRRAYISLSAKAREAMTRYFADLRRLGGLAT